MTQSGRFTEVITMLVIDSTFYLLIMASLVYFAVQTNKHIKLTQ